MTIDKKHPYGIVGSSLAMGSRGIITESSQPPALGDDLETLAWLVDDSKDGHRSVFRNDPTGWAHGFQVRELVDRAHVARLQAEVSDLTEENRLLTRANAACGKKLIADRDEKSQLQAEVERITDAYKGELDHQARELYKRRMRIAELEGLLRKQAEHIAILAENTLSYSSGIGSLIKTKEVNDAAYAALAHGQIVNTALAEGAKS